VELATTTVRYTRWVSDAATETRIARLTVDQVHAMLEAGILEDGAPIELIDGVLVYKDRSSYGEAPMTIGKRHALSVSLLAELGPELAARGCHMRTQSPISLPPHDEPEPDGAVVRGRTREYTDRLPSADDVSAVIEVADASLAYDRTEKLALYARAGIDQYVIVNLRRDCVEVHERPVIDERRYEHVVVLRRGEVFALRVGPGERFELDPARVLP
jgi:Uma2 family endonuclease